MNKAAHGVTGACNMSGYPFHLRLIAQKAKGQLIAPDMLTTGPILNSDGPNAMILQTSVSTAEEARRAVRQQHQAGRNEIIAMTVAKHQVVVVLLSGETSGCADGI